MNDDNNQTFLVTLKGGGGPELVRRALANKFAELSAWRASCVIVGPVDRPLRYVQAIVTAAGVRVESVGSLYLRDSEHELTEADLAALAAFGWLAPPEPDQEPDWEEPRNWWRELAGPGCLADAAGLMVATLIEVHHLQAREPLELRVFDAANKHYRWEVDVDHPCGGYLLAV